MSRDWEQCYRSGETPWDKGSAAPPLIELMEKFGPGIWGKGPVLVPGCGTGHDVREIAAAGVGVVGVDIAPSAVAAARGGGRVGGEEYRVGDFLSSDWGNGMKFSAIWEHTCFCAISPDRRSDYAAAAARMVDSGGALAGVFYLRPWDPGEEENGPPYAVTTEEVIRCFAPWFLLESGWVPERAYPGREGREWIGLFRRLPMD